MSCDITSTKITRDGVSGTLFTISLDVFRKKFFAMPFSVAYTTSQNGLETKRFTIKEIAEHVSNQELVDFLDECLESIDSEEYESSLMEIRGKLKAINSMSAEIENKVQFVIDSLPDDYESCSFFSDEEKTMISSLIKEREQIDESSHH